MEKKLVKVLIAQDIPSVRYELTNGYTLLPVITPPSLLKLIEPEYRHQHKVAIGALALCDGNLSFFESPISDIVMLHSFLFSDHRIYKYTETDNSVFAENELQYLDDLSDTRDITKSLQDFDRIALVKPMKLSPEAKVALSKLLNPEWSHVIQNIEDNAQLNIEKLIEKLSTDMEHIYLNYKKAFDLFCFLKSSREHHELYEQICMYLFSKNMFHVIRMYRNSNLQIALYIAILESFIGKPNKCTEVLNCDRCGTILTEHYVVSLEKHFKDNYGSELQELRNIRHKAFHSCAYSDFIALIADSVLQDTKSEVFGINVNYNKDKVKRANELWEKVYVVEEFIERELQRRFLKLYFES